MDNPDQEQSSRILLRLVRRSQATDRLPEQAASLSEAAWQRLEHLTSVFESELRFADCFLAEAPPSSRVQMLLTNSTPLRKVAVLQRFIERAYSFRHDQPADGLQVTDDLISWTRDDPSPLIAAIRTRAWMERGNLLRILGDPAAAHEALAVASRELEANGSDPLELARYQELLGILERDCGNFAAATDLLRKALAKVRRWGDSYSLQRVLIATSLAELYNNNCDQAGELLDESLRTEEPDSLLLRFSAVNKLLVYLCSGQPHQAYQSLLRVRSRLGPSWLHGFPELNRIYALWTEGQILNTLRFDDEAIALLRRVREFFICSARGYEVCQISIELASNFAAQDRLEDVRRELDFGLQFCSPRKPLDRHAREAVLLLQATLQHQGRLGADQIRSVTNRLDCIHRTPLQAPATLHNLLSDPTVS
jgi:tetratricopeptide (TPR) repeat protein